MLSYKEGQPRSFVFRIEVIGISKGLSIVLWMERFILKISRVEAYPFRKIESLKDAKK